MARNSAQRMLVSMLVLSLAFVPCSVQSITAQSMSAIAGTVNGPGGPMAGTTVQVLDAAGAIVGSATTSASGAFRLENLAPGTYAVRALSSTGSVIATSLAAVPAAGMTVTASLTATAAALAGVASAATVAAAGAGRATGLSRTTKVILASVGAAAATLGVTAIITTRDEASGRR